MSRLARFSPTVEEEKETDSDDIVIRFVIPPTVNTMGICYRRAKYASFVIVLMR